MIASKSASRFAVVLLLCGCSTPGAVFVTKTSLSVVDVDSTPPEVTLAFHRVEGFIGPRNRDGNVPPVLARLETNRNIFNPRIKQVYATGSAAERLVGDGTSDNSNCSSCNDTTEGSPVFFGTSTSFGFRVGLSPAGGVDGLALGFRRKEVSVVPALAKDAAGNFHYPSLLATVELGGGRPASGAVPEFEACQAFATGTAATALAAGIKDDSMRDFGCATASIRTDLMLEYRGSELRQRAEVSRVLNCYVVLPHSSRVGVWNDAQRHGLFSDATGADQDKMIEDSVGPLQTILAEQKRAATLQKEEERAAALARADGMYTNRMLFHTSGQLVKNELRGSALREQLLRSHREFVCAQIAK